MEFDHLADNDHARGFNIVFFRYGRQIFQGTYILALLPGRSLLDYSGRGFW